MTAGRQAASGAKAGFALIEAIAAMALMGIILSALAMITSQWLQSWRTTYDRVQRSESVAVALDRIADDIAAAQFVHVDGSSAAVLFEGTERAIVLVRNAIGPNAERGPELVRIGEAMDIRGAVVTRSRVAFVPGTLDVDPASGAVVLLRRPYRVSFGFAGADGVWRSAWQNEDALPAAVQVAVLDQSGRQYLVRNVSVRVQRPPPENCGGGACRPGEVATANASQPDGAPPTLEQVTAGLSR